MSFKFIDTRTDTSEYQQIIKEIRELKDEIKNTNYDDELDAWYQISWNSDYLNSLIEMRDKMEEEYDF